MRNEPVRAAGHTAALAVTGLAFFAARGVRVDPRLAFAVAGGLGGIVAAATELARSRAWGPQTVDTIIDADTVISAAEGTRSYRDGR